jgi:hypothetical protein
VIDQTIGRGRGSVNGLGVMSIDQEAGVELTSQSYAARAVNAA